MHTHTYIQTKKQTYIEYFFCILFIHTYIHTYTYIYIHTYIHTQIENLFQCDIRPRAEKGFLRLENVAYKCSDFYFRITNFLAIGRKPRLNSEKTPMYVYMYVCMYVLYVMHEYKEIPYLQYRNACKYALVWKLIYRSIKFIRMYVRIYFIDVCM